MLELVSLIVRHRMAFLDQLPRVLLICGFDKAVMVRGWVEGRVGWGIGRGIP